MVDELKATTYPTLSSGQGQGLFPSGSRREQV